MAGKGAPLGNTYAAKDRRWTGMLQRVLAEPCAGGDRLRKIALKLVQAAEEGQPWAITELANRLDGKPVQPVDVKDERQHQPITNALLEWVAAGGKPDEFEQGRTVQ